MAGRFTRIPGGGRWKNVWQVSGNTLGERSVV
jgi:hypothetical protein